MAKELLNKDGSPMREYTSPLLEELHAEDVAEQSKGLAYWKANAEDNYMTTPISVLRYITELEKAIEITEERAFAIFKAGQDSMEEGGKSFEQWFIQTYGGH
jgi:hypothetical protein